MIAKIVHKTCITSIFCLFCITTQAEDIYDIINGADLEEVVIDHNRKTIDAYAVTSAYTMDSNQIAAIGSMQVSDALKYFGGVSIKDYGGIGGLKTVSVRGLGACHTAVAYDGIVETNMQTGQIDLGRISTYQTASIQLVNGTDNNLLQPAILSASATTLNVESKNPKFSNNKNYNLNTAIKYGSFNTYAASMAIENRLSEKWHSTIAAEWTETDGNYPYIQQNGDLSTTLKRNNSDTQRFKTEIAVGAKETLLGNINIKSYLHTSQQGLPTNILYNPTTSERTWNNDIFLQGQSKKLFSNSMALLITGKYSYNYSRYLNTDVNNLTGKTDNTYKQHLAYLSTVLRYSFTEKISASVAEDISYSTLHGNGYYNETPNRVQINGSYKIKYANETVTAIAGLNHIGTTDIKINRISPTVAANIHFIPSWGLFFRASAKEAIRIPTFNDLYFEQVGRRDLKPEIAHLYSAGFVWNRTFNHIDATIHSDFFYNDITNKIMAVPGKSIAMWMMRNIGHSISRGFENGTEVSATYKNISLTLSASYTYQRAMDKTLPNGTTYNHQLPYTPRHSGSFIISIETPRIGACINSFASGEYYSNSYNGKEYRMDAYSETGAVLWYSIKQNKQHIQLRTEIINLFNTQYELVTNYPMPGRQFRIGLNISL